MQFVIDLVHSLVHLLKESLRSRTHPKPDTSLHSKDYFKRLELDSMALEDVRSALQRESEKLRVLTIETNKAFRLEELRLRDELMEL